MRPTVAVVLAVVEASATLAHVFARMPKVDELVLVDGGSIDDTVRVARALWPGVAVVEGRGLRRGDALRVGSRATTSDIVVFLDVEGSGDPAELPRFLQALFDGADMATGTRFAGSGRRPGNGAILRLANTAFGTAFSDLGFGYHAFWRRALERLVVDNDGVAVDVLVAIRAARAGLVVAEVLCGESPRLDGHRRWRPVRDRLGLLGAIASEWAAPAERGLVDLDAVRAP